nr:rho-related GTP-binding protein RhoF isoform X1 [Bubalus bubalis]XP_025123454.1 rho-related GTP-binding protein RhoF isoform X1 [Bubalus bubalis]XP_025123455.1 rho-related GTP-binding protein RhoF isoform X1 [Bubalus bubalis]XP_025123456.1 rho-related GTP-binding protein RhoF isoform X1 [Bubalus bubalis]XP_025123457.1 rho-related GTP-binding protein RhoF isoform X1 [Bubalus bubalis]XP_025123459.1 rho-related GTP-binding protein RhoF isoform X1 [Bubalus bubalis]XP_025123460.1 rho-related GT
MDAAGAPAPAPTAAPGSGRKELKIVIVGDGGCGKTSLLMVYSQGSFPEHYAPSVFEKYTASVTVGSKEVTLNLYDTAGPERLRADPSCPLPGMFCQVSGECGRRLPGGRQGCPQCSEESTAAETTPALPAALTAPSRACGPHDRTDRAQARRPMLLPRPHPCPSSRRALGVRHLQDLVSGACGQALGTFWNSPFPAGALTTHSPPACVAIVVVRVGGAELSPSVSWNQHLSPALRSALVTTSSQLCVPPLHTQQVLQAHA